MSATWVLGTGLSHSGSAVLLRDGEVVVGIEKERISRIKRDGGNDTVAVQYCLDAAGISLDDVSLVVQTANFEVPPIGRFDGRRVFGDFDPERLISISHHLAHAYSAVGSAPFGACDVLVIDGCGSPIEQCVDLAGGSVVPRSVRERPPGPLWCEKDSFYRFDGQSMWALWKDFSPLVIPDNTSGFPTLPTTKHSIGGFYAAISQYCLGDRDAAGKLMGLAPYGDPARWPHRAFESRDGRCLLRARWNEHLDAPWSNADDFRDRFGYFADVAAWAQDQLERALLELIHDRVDRVAGGEATRLCFTGGVALNAVANAAIRRADVAAEVFFEPAAGDHGLALGCAYYGWLAALGQTRVDPDGSTCFGRTYSSAEIDTAVAALRGAEYLVTGFDDDAAVIDATAHLLAGGDVVAWFSGGAEFGPRALGRRSILASPFAAGVRDHINANIKFREDFRPFAPAVLREDVGRYFEHEWDSPYMILVNQVRNEWRSKLAEVCHVDGSARVQTVDTTWNERFSRLLRELKRVTGESVLLNTSFNVRGMPIVETPADAVAMFANSALDALVLEQTLIRRR